MSDNPIQVENWDPNGNHHSFSKFLLVDGEAGATNKLPMIDTSKGKLDKSKILEIIEEPASARIKKEGSDDST